MTEERDRSSSERARSKEQGDDVVENERESCDILPVKSVFSILVIYASVLCINSEAAGSCHSATSADPC